MSSSDTNPDPKLSWCETLSCPTRWTLSCPTTSRTPSIQRPADGRAQARSWVQCWGLAAAAGRGEGREGAFLSKLGEAAFPPPVSPSCIACAGAWQPSALDGVESTGSAPEASPAPNARCRWATLRRVERDRVDAQPEASVAGARRPALGASRWEREYGKPWRAKWGEECWCHSVLREGRMVHPPYPIQNINSRGGSPALVLPQQDPGTVLSMSAKHARLDHH